MCSLTSGTVIVRSLENLATRRYVHGMVLASLAVVRWKGADFPETQKIGGQSNFGSAVHSQILVTLARASQHFGSLAIRSSKSALLWYLSS